MVSKEELKEIVMLNYLRDEMLDKVIPLVDILAFDEREAVFRQGGRADRFYMLRKGKILLEKRLSDKVTLSLGAVKAGYSMGWSAILDGGFYTSDAVCAEPCQIFSIRRDRFTRLLENNHEIGYILSQRLLRVIKSRLDQRTVQFLKAIQNHPDLQPLFEVQP